MRELSWLAEGRSWARLESVPELCAGRDCKWEEGAEAPLLLMFKDGESGFGVEDADEAESSRREARVICNGPKVALLKSDGTCSTFTVESQQRTNTSVVGNLLSRAAEVLTPFRPFWWYKNAAQCQRVTNNRSQDH